MKNVILDTDIGDDFDDAFALALAMQMPELNILGVVTVFKDVDTRCKMARMMLDLGGFASVPVCKGFSRPLAQREMFHASIDFSEKLWSYVDDCEAHGGEFEDGFSFYVRTLEGAESPVTVVTLGALTNVAYLLRERPDLACKIEKLVIMGGAFDMNYSEYNLSCDPEAAQAVIASPVPKLFVGLDVTFQCFRNAADLRTLQSVGHPVTDVLIKMVGTDRDAVYLHDPLAVYACAHEDAVKFRREKLAVETKGEYTRGVVVKMCNCNWHVPPEEANASYAHEVDGRAFIDEYVRRMQNYAPRAKRRAEETMVGRVFDEV